MLFVIISILVIPIFFYIKKSKNIGNRYVLGNEIIVTQNTDITETSYDEYEMDFDNNKKELKKENNTDIYDQNLASELKIELSSNVKLPRKIIYYHKGVPYVFNYGSDEYNKIIALNNKRDNGNLESYFKLFHGSIYDLRLNIDMLEYYYDKNSSINFNLGAYEYISLSREKRKVKFYWLYTGQLDYVGLAEPKELVEYLNSVIPK